MQITRLCRATVLTLGLALTSACAVIDGVTAASSPADPTFTPTPRLQRYEGLTTLPPGQLDQESAYDCPVPPGGNPATTTSCA